MESHQENPKMVVQEEEALVTPEVPDIVHIAAAAAVEEEVDHLEVEEIMMIVLVVVEEEMIMVEVEGITMTTEDHLLTVEEEERDHQIVEIKKEEEIDLQMTIEREERDPLKNKKEIRGQRIITNLQLTIIIHQFTLTMNIKREPMMIENLRRMKNSKHCSVF
jgi:hypothetical protein